MTNLPSLNTSKRSHNELWLRIEAFLSTKAANTAITYKGVIAEWCQFLGAEAGTPQSTSKLLTATDLHAIAYRKWLTGRPGQKARYSRRHADTKSIQIRPKKAIKRDGLQSTQSNATIWKKFAALRRMYRVIIAADLGVRVNPFDVDRVPPPPKDSGKKRPTEMIDYKLVTEILQIPDPATPKGRRDRGVLSMLFGGGMRRSEVASLRIGDVRITPQGTAYVYLRATKSGKDAEQAIPDWASKTIRLVLKDRLEQGADKGDYLFISYRGRHEGQPFEQHFSHAGIYNLFKKCCMAAGAGTDVSPHSARATAITRLLDDGMSHRLVKEFSRHSSVQMVEVYDKRRTSVDESPGKKLSF